MNGNTTVQKLNVIFLICIHIHKEERDIQLHDNVNGKQNYLF